MLLNFYKYQATGNDFIIIDGRSFAFPEKPSLISQLCHRRFSIGADGLILIKNDSKSNFLMKYFNSDGQQSSLCGNGARCAVAFSKKMSIISSKEAYFNTIDGRHYALIEDDNLVSLKMKEVFTITSDAEHVFVNTGSPHHVIFTENVDQIDVFHQGRAIRYKWPYFDEGVNVDFVELIDKKSLRVRTYERGVENETLSCGTGVTAAALAAYYTERLRVKSISIHTRGGILSVDFQEIQGVFTEIWLHGQVSFIFQGLVTLVL